MSHEESDSLDLQQGEDPLTTSSVAEDEMIRSSRWDSSCKSHNTSSDLYLELLRGSHRRQNRWSAADKSSSQAGGGASTLASDEELTEATASESFSCDTSLGSSLSSIGVTALTMSPFPSDWNSPKTPSPLTLGAATRTQLQSVHNLLEQTLPFLDSEKDTTIHSTSLSPIGARDKLVTLVEDEEEDATSSSRQDDSFQPTDDEFEPHLPMAYELRGRAEVRRTLSETESLSDATENFCFGNDSIDSDDDYSSSDDVSDDFMVDYVTSSDDESEDDVPLPSDFHTPLTSIASLDKLPTAVPSLQHSKRDDSVDGNEAASSPSSMFKNISSINPVDTSSWTLLDEVARQMSTCALVDFIPHPGQKPASATGEQHAQVMALRHSDSLDCLPKLPCRRSNSSLSADELLTSIRNPVNANRRVRFAPTCKIQEYAVTVGDNPSCSGPCPLSLDWEHTTAYQQLHGHVGSNSGGLRSLSLAVRRERIMRVQGLNEQRLRLLELQVSNRVNRYMILSKTKKKERASQLHQPGHLGTASSEDEDRLGCH